MATNLSIEARLIDFVSKNLDKINMNIKSFSKSAGKSFKEVGESVNHVYETLDKTLKGRGGFLGDMAKFAGLSKMMNALEESLSKVFESAVRGSPALEKKLDAVKDKVNQLVTEAAQKLLPVFIKVFDFMLENWEKIRFAINLVISVAKDLFNLFALGLQTITLGFKGFILGVTGVLNTLGIVNDKTFEKMSNDVEAYGIKVAESADQLKIFGNTRDTVSKGVAGQGKAPKANIDIFNKNEKKDAEELAAFRLSLAKQNESLLGELAKEGMQRDLALSKAKYDNLNRDLLANKNYAKLTEKEKYEALKAIDDAGEQDKLNITKKYLDEETKYRHKIANASQALKVGAIDPGRENQHLAEKELQLSEQKYAQLKTEMLDDKMFAILTAQEKADAIKAIEIAAAADRKKILEDEQQRKLESTAKIVGDIQRSYEAAGNLVMAFAFESAEAVQKSADRQTKSIDNQLKKGLITQEQAEQAKQKILDQSEKKNRERAEAEKHIALVMAIVNTAQAVTAALAHYDYVGAILAGVTGGTQIATIEAQGFKDGGLIPGKNTPIVTNEDGRPEYILNADTVARVGVGNLDRMNAGGMIGGTTVINNNYENHYSPSLSQSGGNGKQIGFKEFFDSNAREFFDWFEEKQKKGFGRSRG